MLDCFQSITILLKVKRFWIEVSEILSMSPENRENMWNTIQLHYNEKHRFYHTLTHIHELLLLVKQHRALICDYPSVVLSIFFHDVIYNPRRHDNEEASAEVFKVMMEESIQNKYPQSLANKVVKYILETKTHNVLQSSDEDLRLFIDFDMSILGRDRFTYMKYAQNIRREYIHIPLAEYCKGRATFLRKFLNETASIYATERFQKTHEQAARDNLLWECGLLDCGRIPGGSDDVSLRKSWLAWEWFGRTSPLAVGAMVMLVSMAVAVVAPTVRSLRTR